MILLANFVQYNEISMTMEDPFQYNAISKKILANFSSNVPFNYPNYYQAQGWVFNWPTWWSWAHEKWLVGMILLRFLLYFCFFVVRPIIRGRFFVSFREGTLAELKSSGGFVLFFSFEFYRCNSADLWMQCIWMDFSHQQYNPLGPSFAKCEVFFSSLEWPPRCQISHQSKDNIASNYISKTNWSTACLHLFFEDFGSWTQLPKWCTTPLKRTVCARKAIQKRKQSSSNHPFSGANLLLVSGSQIFFSKLRSFRTLGATEEVPIEKKALWPGLYICIYIYTYPLLKKV